MRDARIVDRYAQALSAVIKDDAALDGVANDLQTLGALIEEHHHFRNAVANPAIDPARRARVLDGALDKAGITGPVKRLAHEMLRRGRITSVGAVADRFGALADKRLGRIRVDVTTGAELQPENEAALRESLARYTGLQVRLVKRVDPYVIGGVRARIEDTIIDGTLRSRLERLRQALIAQEIS